MGNDAATEAMPESLEVTESAVAVGDAAVTVLTAGSGKTVLVLHDELGFPGWMRWTRELADERRLAVPLQPGFGQTPRLGWIRDYRDLAALYLQLARELGDAPVDVIGFSAGGFIAAEMAAACPEAIDRMVLVAPLGVRPTEGEIFDFLAVTARTHLGATIADHDVDEAKEIYGGAMTPERFELFEAARAETSRLGWEPFMFSPSLPDRISLVTVPTLVIWGDADRIVPQSSMRTYAEAIDGARLEVLPGCGHRPEIEGSERFTELVGDFFRQPRAEG